MRLFNLRGKKKEKKRKTENVVKSEIKPRKKMEGKRY